MKINLKQDKLFFYSFLFGEFISLLTLIYNLLFKKSGYLNNILLLILISGIIIFIIYVIQLTLAYNNSKTAQPVLRKNKENIEIK